ncbi:helix-turn-helix domain-containing protein [Streptomyces zhihengii]
MSRKRILADVWQQPYVEDQTVDVHLRAAPQTGREAVGPRYLHTVRGIGIKLVTAP